MAITKQKKVELISSMSERLKDAKSVVFVNFNELSARDTKNLRRKLSADNVGYFVTKKTLAKRVLGDLNAKGEMPELPGQLAIAYGEDLLAPARETYGFQSVPLDKGSIEIVGGIFDGEYKSKEEMMAIATIPPLQVLRGMFVNLINSPIQRFAIAMGEIANSKGAAPVEAAAEEAPVAAEAPAETPAAETATEAPAAPAEEAPAAEVTA